MIQIVFIKAKWNAFVQRRMSCAYEGAADTEHSDLSSSYTSEESEYLEQ